MSQSMSFMWKEVVLFLTVWKVGKTLRGQLIREECLSFFLGGSVS